MAVSIPDGWKNFLGGASDPLLCSNGSPPRLSANRALDCTRNILTVALEVISGAPPFTWSTTKGMLTVTGLRTVTLSIDQAIPVSADRCNALAYGYGASGTGIGTTPNCRDFPSWCVSNFYNCFGQWVQWTPLNGLFEPSCANTITGLPGANYPTLGRFLNCPPCPDVSAIAGCVPVPTMCGLPMLNKDGIDITNACNGSTYLRLQLPALLPPFYCFDPATMGGVTFVNYGATFTFGAVSGQSLQDTTSIARLAAELYLHPENGVRFFDQVSALNTQLGGCAPCAILRSTDIVVSVTDGSGESVAIEVHVN